MKDVHLLKIKEKTHQLVLKVYKATECFPNADTDTLTTRIQMISVSISEHVIAGYKQDSDVELARYLLTAIAQTNKLEYLLLLARDLGYLAVDLHNTLNREVEHVRKLLTASVQYLYFSIDS